jgi:hypothetical protein
MAQAAHWLFRPMVVAWQKRPGCVRIAVTTHIDGHTGERASDGHLEIRGAGALDVEAPPSAVFADV